MNETFVVVNQLHRRVQKTHCRMQTSTRVTLSATTCHGCRCKDRNLCPPTPNTLTMLLQVCMRAIYSSSEHVFEAELSPVYDGMCFGHGSTPHSLCMFAAAAGNKQSKWQLLAGKCCIDTLGKSNNGRSQLDTSFKLGSYWFTTASDFNVVWAVWFIVHSTFLRFMFCFHQSDPFSTRLVFDWLLQIMVTHSHPIRWECGIQTDMKAVSHRRLCSIDQRI